MTWIRAGDSSDPHAPLPPLKPPRRRLPLSPLSVLIILLAAAFLVFNCSGWHFPMLNSRGSLERRLSGDLAITLPAGATLEHGTRVATRDPGEYYALTMTPAEAAAFAAQLRRASTRGWRVGDEDPAQPWTMGETPEWWRPQDAEDVERIELLAPDNSVGYDIFISPASGKVFVFWFST